MPRKSTSLKSFRQGLSQLLDELAVGDEVIITDYRKKVGVFRKERDMHKLAFFNHAGGSGKTCSVRDMGFTLAQMGKRVLLLDMDPQASLSKWLGFDEVDTEDTLYHTLLEKAPLPTPKEASGLHLIPANLSLATLDTQLVSVTGGTGNIRLRNALKNLEGYDLVLIDCPPNLAALTTNAALAADKLVVTVPAAPKGLDGLQTIQNMVETYQEVNEDLDVLMYVLNRFDGRTNVHNDVVHSMRMALPNLISTPIAERKSAFDHAQIQKVPVPEYQPDGPSAQEILAVCKQLLLRLEGKDLTFERLAQTLGAEPTALLYAELMGIRIKASQKARFEGSLTPELQDEIHGLVKV